MASQHAYVRFLSITAALGGFLFGFDTAVISGAEREIQGVWQLDDWTHGLAVAIALYGTVLGALFGGMPADLLGRKKALLAIGLLYLFSATGSTFAPEVYSFMFFRFLGGLGVGASSVVAPMYIAEIAPARQRGQLVALYQFNIVLGILVAYFSNYLIGTAAPSAAWRWMLGVEILPAFLYTLLMLRIPESPRWLLAKRQDFTQARLILGKTDPEGVDAALTKAQEELLTAPPKAAFRSLFQPAFRRSTVFAMLIAFFNQLSGINAVIYFAPRIFEAAGLPAEDALFSTIGIGVVNVLATLAGLYLIDRLGRRVLMGIGSVGYVLSLSLMAYSYLGSGLPEGLLPFFVFFFIASHAIGQGAVIWVFIGEMFPNALRAKGQALGCGIHWVLAAVITNVFPALVSLFGAGQLFLFFAAMMLLQTLWVWKFMPETKGKSLEEVHRSPAN